MQVLTTSEQRALADDCVHCGFCLPACPTYVLWGREADSPRGRIYLMKAVLEGRTRADDPAFTEHIDSCLGCMACVTACPSGVKYDRLIEATRPLVEQEAQRSAFERVYRKLLFSLFPFPRRLQPLAALLRLAQTSGLIGAMRAAGLRKMLPGRVAALEELTPTVGASTALPAIVPAAGTPRRRVGMLLGCVQREFFPHVNAATARVLAAEGCEVHIPPAQGCCGALSLHSGMPDDAAAAARRLIDVFDLDRLDHIVINAAGCGSAMKEYGELLRNDPVYAERARAFAAKCVDVSELLADLPPQAARQPVRLKVAYHDACHLQHAQRVKSQPRQVLASIPALDVMEIGEPDICCGSAGVYNLLQPDAARELRDRKVAHVLQTGCEALVSSNPGCLLQIAAGAEAAGRPIRTLHFVELVDASISQHA